MQEKDLELVPEKSKLRQVINFVDGPQMLGVTVKLPESSTLSYAN